MCLHANAAYGQSWPSRPIRVIVPMPSGGGSDYLARILAEPLRSALGEPIVVENRVGADGRIGVEYASRQVADGYNLLFITSANAAHPSLLKNMPYDLLRDFTPVSMVARVPWGLLVGPGMAAPTPKEFVATPKEFLDFARSNPGKVTFGSSGIGSPFHLAGEMLKSMAGIDMLHVPYKGSAAVTNALLSGEVMCAFAPIGPFLQQIRSGKLRALGIVTGQRTAILPELATLEEALALPGFATLSWFGVVAPAGTPRPHVERMNAEIARIVREPAFARDHLLRQSYEPYLTTPEETGEAIRSAVALFAKIVRGARITAE
jgi:tripartite-type tricarboxylate transporter receptor subunit TctC